MSVSEAREGEWINHGTVERVYSSWWLSLTIDKVEKPDGSIVNHEVVHGPDAGAMVIFSPTRGILMIWRHRFMPNTWGWEIPGGALDPDEKPADGAKRECLEETGWSPLEPIHHLSRHHPSCGLLNQTFDLYLATDATQHGPPTDQNEAVRVEWRSPEQVVADLKNGLITDGLTQLAITLALGRQGYGHLLAESVPMTTIND